MTGWFQRRIEEWQRREKKAQLRRQEAQHRRQLQQQEAERRRAEEAFRRSPPGRAREAYNRGRQVFQHIEVLTETKPNVVPMVGAFTVNERGANVGAGPQNRGTAGSAPKSAIETIETEGWRAVHFGYVFQQTQSASRDKLLASGQQQAFGGRVLGILHVPTSRRGREYRAGDTVWTMTENNDAVTDARKFTERVEQQLAEVKSQLEGFSDETIKRFDGQDERLDRLEDGPQRTNDRLDSLEEGQRQLNADQRQTFEHLSVHDTAGKVLNSQQKILGLIAGGKTDASPSSSE